MKKLYAQSSLVILLSVITASKSFAQGVGINTSVSAPHAAALLHVDLGTDLNKGFLITGTSSTSALMPNLGRGSRLMFYPAKSAFRAGWVNGTEWDNLNVGRHSVAMGVSTIASGDYSTALGIETVASGESATAMGEETEAIGGISTAMGIGSIASGSVSTAMGSFTSADGFASMATGAESIAGGDFSTAMGFNTYAGASYSTALGYRSYAGGLYATAMGHNTTASGQASFAMGSNTFASGLHSVALGTNVSTNNKKGSFFFGDSDPEQKGLRPIGFQDQFAARFNGGYYFISNDAYADLGVRILPGGNAWVSICDENRKENFEPLDGEGILEKMKGMKFSSWNYKTQDPTQHRHYGIMAQDFFNAFGNDKYGKIGNDSTVNPIDMIGIDMAAIQALEKRTAQLTEENTQLRNEMNELKRRLEKMEK
jgi:hypothetical protein